MLLVHADYLFHVNYFLFIYLFLIIWFLFILLVWPQGNTIVLDQWAYLTHTVNFPCVRKPEDLEETDDFWLSVDLP